MKTVFDQLKEKISDGYYIYSEIFADEDKTTVYSIRKDIDESSRIIFCEIARNVAFMLKREMCVTIKVAEQETVALNFIPMPVKPGCVRWLTQD